MSLTAAQINTIYLDTLQRSASSAEQTAWVNLDTSGLLSDSQIINDIVTSPEAQNYTWVVTRLYQAAFGRVPDPAGLAANVKALKSGAVTELQLDAAFLSSAEAVAKYGPINTTAPINTLGATGTIFLQALYNNVLSRAPSPAEIAAWEATGETAPQVLMGFADSAEFEAKANPAIQSLETANALSYTVTAGNLFNNPSNPSAGTAFTLVVGPDNFTTGQGNDTYNANIQVAAQTFAVGDTLNSGDVIIDHGVPSTNALNLVLGAVTVAATIPGNNVTVQGVGTWNVANTSGLGVTIDGVGATALITGLTVLNVNNSAGGGFFLGGAGAGNGIGSLLATVGLTNDANAVTVDVAAASLVAGSTLTVNINNVGAVAGDEFLGVGPDSGAATGGYATWTINTTGTNFFDASAFGFTGATTVNIAGSGATQLDGDGLASWTKVKTISLANETGTVFVTGADAGGYHVNSGAGFLTNNTAIASYTGGSGNDIVDLSGLTTAQLAAMTTLNGGTGTNETLIVSNAVAGALSGNVVTPLAAFQTIGLSAGFGGTVLMANFPGATGLAEYGAGDGAITATASAVTTFNFNDNGFSSGVLTINGPATGANVANFTLGTTAGFFETNTAGAFTNHNGLFTTGYSMVNITSIGVGGTNTLSGNSNAETFTAPTGAQMAVNISGTNALTVNGLTLNGNGSSIVDTDTGVLTVHAWSGGGAVLFSTNAQSINASASGGLFMTGFDAATNGIVGDVITGSATKANTLVGSQGNDALTVGTAGLDNIWTDGGADAIVLGAHAKTDSIFLVGSGGSGSGVAGALAQSITLNNGTTEGGFWGNAPSTAGALISAVASTSADMSTVAGFVAGPNSATADTLVFSNGAWGHSAGFLGLITVAGVANASIGVANLAYALNGSTVTNTTADVLFLSGPTFTGAAGVATALNTGTFGVTLTTAGATAGVGDLLVAYTDITGATRIADLAINVTATATESLVGHVIGASDMVQLTGIASTLISGGGTTNNIHFIA